MNPYAIIGALLLSIGLAGGGYYAGWDQRGDHEAAIALKVKDKADIALKAARERADGLAGELADEVRNIKTVTVEVIKEVPKVTTVYVEVPGEIPKIIPPAVYTYGFVRVWNDALYAGSLRPGAGQPADNAAGADTVRAAIDSPDILSNAAENFSKYAECRAQLKKLILFEKGRAVPASAQ